MTDLFRKLIRWVIRHFMLFLVVVALLVAGNALQRELQEYVSDTAALDRLKNVRKDLTLYISRREKEVSESVTRLQNAPLALKVRRDKIDEEIRKLDSKRRSPAVRTLALLTGGSGVADDLKGDIEVKLLEQERVYVVNLISVIEGEKELERLRQLLRMASDELEKNERDQATLIAEHPIRTKIPWTTERQSLQELRKNHKELLAGKQLASRNYQDRLKLIQILKKSDPFKVQRDLIERELQPLTKRIVELDEKIPKNWVGRFLELVIDVVPTAIVILLSIILIPIAIKAVFYFVIAPLASRRPAICLLPGHSGAIEGTKGRFSSLDAGAERTKNSEVSLSTIVDEAHELLLLPEYLQVAPVLATKDTKWLLDYSYPLSSLASGMVALTRIRATKSESVGVSATKDPLSEVGIISVPEGSAVVFQPHSLVGISQNKDRPTRITRHWRFGSLHAWLTLQLRYLVFHGPAKLIVEGCRGIVIEKAGSGRSINQAATIGYSANLAYSTTRCETFFSYLTGKQELFNDNFAGGPGFYFYEETPHFGKKTGIWGRGIEGILDSVLKIFGI